MLQAAQLLGGNSSKMGSLKAQDIFGSIIPKVESFNIEPTTAGQNVNSEIISAQKEYFENQQTTQEADSPQLNSESYLDSVRARNNKPRFSSILDKKPTNSPETNTTPSSGVISAQVTRYGFEGDAYQNHTATSKGSKYEIIGNRNNRLEEGISIALPPKTSKALGINPKAGDFVEAEIGGEWQKFRVDDTAGNHKNHRIDFFDPSGKRVKIDGSKINIRKYQ